MGRGKKGRNSSQRQEFGSKVGGNISNQLRQYHHVSQGPDPSVTRPAVYQNKVFPTLDSIIHARHVDDQRESIHGINYNALDLPIVKLKTKFRGAPGNSTHYDDEEWEERSSLRAEYWKEAEVSRSACLTMLFKETCDQIEDNVPGTREGSKCRNLTALCTENLAPTLSDEFSDYENASALGALLRERFRPEITFILSIAATRIGVLNVKNLSTLNNPFCTRLALGSCKCKCKGEVEGEGKLSVVQCALFLGSLRKSAHLPAPDDWEILSLPSHISGLEIDLLDRGPSEVFLFDLLFLSKDDITAFQSIGNGLKGLHLYSFTTSPASIPAFWEQTQQSMCAYQERCVRLFILLFLSSDSFNTIDTLTIDHCADFHFTISGLNSIGHAIAEARHATKGNPGEGMPNLRTLRVSGIHEWDAEGATRLCTSFRENMDIELCIQE